MFCPGFERGKMVYVFNTLRVDRVYKDSDIKKLVPLREYGLDEGFYGGRVKFISPTEEGILLLVEYRDGELKVIDTAAENLHSSKIPLRLVRELCRKRKIAYGPQESREELIARLEAAV